MATKVERHLLRINADRSINVETDIPIVAGSIGVDEVLITFEEPEDWQDMSLTVTMVSSVVDTPYTVLWDGVSAFNVPWELTQEVGVIGFSVLGISSSSQTYQRGLTQSSVGLITIVTPGINVGEPPVEPTPSTYERVLAMIQSLPEVENRAEAVINDLDNAFRGVAQYLPVGMGNVVTAELDGTDSDLVSVADAFKNGKLLGAKVYGKSTQVVTTGKNLFDCTAFTWINGYRNDDGDIVISSSHHTSPTPISGNTQYTISGTLSPGSSSSWAIYFLDTSEGWISRLSLVFSQNPYTFTTPENCGYIQIQASNSILNLDDVQIEYGSSATEYEPYSEGVPSPTPDYPREIKSVVEGDVWVSGKNLIDVSDALVSKTGYYATFANNPVYDVQIKNKCKLKSNTTYTLSFDISGLSSAVTASIGYGANGSYLRDLGVPYKYNINNGHVSYTFTTGELPEEDCYFAFRIPRHGVSAEISFGISNIQLEIGAQGTNFVPYVSPDSLHFLPDDVEPLRSLPDGTRDVLTIDANGNGVIERNVGEAVLTSDYTADMAFSTSNQIGTIVLKNAIVQQVNRERFVFSSFQKTSVDNASMPDLSAKVTYNNSADPTSQVACIKNESITSLAGFKTWLDALKPEVLYKCIPYTEIIPASRMPKVPSQYLNAWLEAKDQNGEEIVTDYSIYYEKSIGALLSQIEQALDAAGYPITDYEPEDAMSVAPELSNDANPVTDAQMAAAVTYGFTLN